MTTFLGLVFALSVAAVGFLFGVWVGAKKERGAWLARCVSQDGPPTPVEAGGGVYYVIPENTYCRLCHVRKALCEEGMSCEASAATKAPTKRSLA